jgi:hypothetical protein
MTASFSSTSPAAGALRVLSDERERHRSVFASQGDEAARRRFALPDPASPDYEASLATLEAEIDRASATLDRQDEAKDQVQADRQRAESEEDPAPLSNYKRAEVIKQNSPS